MYRDQPFATPRRTESTLWFQLGAQGLLRCQHNCSETSEAPAAGPNAQYQVNTSVDARIEIYAQLFSPSFLLNLVAVLTLQ